MKQEIRHQHNSSNPLTLLDTVRSQSGTAMYLGMSHLIAGAVALGLSSWLAHLRVLPFSALVITLTGAVVSGFLCTLSFQYSLYLLELTLSRLAQDQSYVAG